MLFGAVVILEADKDVGDLFGEGVEGVQAEQVGGDGRIPVTAGRQRIFRLFAG